MRTCLSMLFLLAVVMAHGQQLLLMRKGNVLARFSPGDEIYFVLKDQDQVHHTSIRAIHEFDFVSRAGDTIRFGRIAKIKFRNLVRRKYARTVALAGAALYGVFLLNKAAFYDNNETAMSGLRFVAWYSMGAACLIYLTSTRTRRLHGINVLKGVGPDSPLYK